MAALSSPRLPRTESKPKRSFPIGRQPLMLKDFLSDNSNLCSSNGFRSFPRQSTVRHILEFDVKADHVVTSKLLRSRSRAASTTISAIHKASEIVIKAVRHLPFASLKSPSVLPRSVSRRLLKREFWKKCRNDDVGQISVTVRVKDILRWRSFRDLVEELPPPLDSPFWSADSVEYAGELEREVAVVKKCLPEFGVGRDSMEVTTGETVDPKGELLFEEKELHSPVSVHDFPFEEDEGSFSSCHQSLANMERRKCMLIEKVQEFESLAEPEPVNLEEQFAMEENTWFEQEGKETNGSEEKAKQQRNHVKATIAEETSEATMDHLLLDFFRHELTSKKQKEEEFDNGMVTVAKAWIHGEYDALFEWEVDETRESYIREMERGLRWSMFEEQEKLALEMEIGVMNNLMDELLVELFVCSENELVKSWIKTQSTARE